jgi:hypothetical protein
MGKIIQFGKFDGIEMGVMDDGTPFLTGGGLALMCDVTPASISDLGEFVSLEKSKPRGGKIASILSQSLNFDSDRFFEKIPYNKQIVNAYPEAVCMAVLEYYAFEAGERCTDKAKQISRLLMRKTFRDFIYSLIGYNRPRLTFTDYMLSRINHHHSASRNPLPDGYFCLFDKMIELLQKFDLRIGYTLGEQWYDTSKGDVRFLEPDISLGIHFSGLFKNEFVKKEQAYQEAYNARASNPKINEFWSTKLKELKWKRDRAYVERAILLKYRHLFDCDIENVLGSLEEYLKREKYSFKPSPDSGRPENLPPAYCYSNDYTSLFYDWLRDVFFKYVWRDYILERDQDGWINRYNKFKSLGSDEQKNILTTSEGKLISGFEFREIWERQLPPANN